MDRHKSKAIRGERRRHRVRKAIHGTATKPRLSVHRTNLQIYAQLIDDDAEITIAAAASNAKDGKLAYGGNIAAAAEVGKKIAEKAKAKGITEAAFDRGAFRFHGRVKALAVAATKAGLKCTGLEEKKKEAAPATADAKKDKKEKKPAPAKA
ncbi:MAG: 50S ribosomal protein L18 [Planctomycetia bacterium]|nr:50S ribosomal protein L18 [Planctomycetia bacterium]